MNHEKSHVSRLQCLRGLKTHCDHELSYHPPPPRCPPAMLWTIDKMKGHSAFHLAIPRNVTLEFVYMLVSVKLIDINIKDTFGMTLFDIIKHKPHFPTLDLVSMVGLIQRDVQLSCSRPSQVWSRFTRKYRGNVCNLKSWLWGICLISQLNVLDKNHHLYTLHESQKEAFRIFCSILILNFAFAC